MNKIIPFDKNFEFRFLDDKSIKINHPVSDYFLKINDLSINLLISLKWILWGYFFLDSISKELKSELSEFSYKDFIDNSLQPELVNSLEFPHIILIDNHKIEKQEDLNNLINNFYNNEFFHENTKIHLKLKINLREFVVISNILFPTLVTFDNI